MTLISCILSLLHEIVPCNYETEQVLPRKVTDVATLANVDDRLGDGSNNFSHLFISEKKKSEMLKYDRENRSKQKENNINFLDYIS